MPGEESVTHWLGLLKAGDPAAAAALWGRYFERLMRLARQKLSGAPRRAADEEDVALSAFDSFCRRAGQGHFARLEGRDDLWQLLALLTVRKALHLRRDEGRPKRGGGAVLDEAALSGATDGAGGDLDQFLSRELAPAQAAQLVEDCRRLLRSLADPRLEEIALARLEGYTAEEIAGRLGCVPRTVERKLRLIRELWSQEVPT
jgi:DNA-directed RNA polymerase specialized sigma24 family protein